MQLCNDNCIVGEVYISNNSGVWYGATIRGEHQPVRIGEFSTIGDYTFINTFSSLGLGIPSSVNIGKNVYIGSNCTLCSCIVDDECVISPGCTILEGARLERGCVIAPYSVVPPGRLIPSGQLWGGSPVSYIKDIDISKRMEYYKKSYKYVEHSKEHIKQIAGPIKELEAIEASRIGFFPDKTTKELEAILSTKTVPKI